MKTKLTIILSMFLLWAVACLCPLGYGIGTISAEEEPTSTLSSYALDNPNLLRKVSLDLRDTNVADAIRYLAEKADINIAVSKNVGGRVTLSFKNVTIKDALDIVLLSNDLAAERRGEIIYCMPAKEYETLHGTKWADPREVRVFKLQYARPTDVLTVLGTLKSAVGNIVVDNESGTVVIMDTPERIARMKEAISPMDKESLTQVFELKYAKAKEVEENLTSRLDAKGIGSITADERSNQLIVTALPKRMDEVEKIIAELDKKTRQVLIEAKIVKVTLSPDFDMGIDWEYVWDHLIKEGKSLVVDSVVQFPISSAISTFGQLTVGTLAENDYTATIKILKTIGETKLLSSPRIAAVNNEEASILIGTREAYITDTVTQGQSTTTTAESVTFLDVGVQLNVTPVINEDGFVTMKIRPEVSAIDRYLTTYYSTGTVRSEIPIVSTTTAETTVMVKDGYTIIIGGLIKDETVRTTKKIPILGDIPFLGMAFRQIDEDKEKTEIVVFLTPHIITGDKDMPDWEEKEIRGLRGYEKEEGDAE